MGAGLFWGIILIVIGLSIIFRVIFDVSIFRVALAIVFILIGIKLLIGRPVFRHEGREDHVIFGERTVRSSPVHGNDYNTVFGKTVFDFRDMDTLIDRKTKVSFNTVFGSTEIILPADLPVIIHVSAVFSSARLPNGNTIAFGDAHFSSGTDKSDSTSLYIEAHVVFGGLDIRQ
jgi:predicted membrane protein